MTIRELRKALRHKAITITDKDGSEETEEIMDLLQCRTSIAMFTYNHRSTEGTTYYLLPEVIHALATSGKWNNYKISNY